MNYVRRFVFVHYDDLLEVRFRQLEKVTDKLYVFVPDTIEQVPMWLVRQMQDMGRDLTWVSVADADYDQAQLLLAYQIGSLHEKVDPGVEFAILSDSPSIDILVAHLQQMGRNCLRVKQRASGGEREPDGGAKAERAVLPAQNRSGAGQAAGVAKPATRAEVEDQDDIALDEADLDDLDLELEDLDTERDDALGLKYDADLAEDSSAEEDEAMFGSPERQNSANGTNGTTGTTGTARASRGGRRDPLHAKRSREEDEAAVGPLADEVVRKLIRSGNRPNEVSLLRSYILLHSSEAEAVRYVEEIIARMRRKGEIRVDGSSVKYTF